MPPPKRQGYLLGQGYQCPLATLELAIVFSPCLFSKGGFKILLLLVDMTLHCLWVTPLATSVSLGNPPMGLDFSTRDI
ncbi:hypothetical protein V6N12_038666 [Hibiscus sabdariffa]|uniref:Uncharacterized protein n=1 Tax=Hibiscus sabdariffa TaxID=183260 RepID=A0ABR2CAH0_9ROSI